jgi:hypothetical protein
VRQGRDRTTGGGTGAEHLHDELGPAIFTGCTSCLVGQAGCQLSVLPQGKAQRGRRHGRLRVRMWVVRRYRTGCRGGGRGDEHLHDESGLQPFKGCALPQAGQAGLRLFHVVARESAAAAADFGRPKRVSQCGVSDAPEFAQQVTWVGAGLSCTRVDVASRWPY